jgi:hypothetical protein
MLHHIYNFLIVKHKILCSVSFCRHFKIELLKTIQAQSLEMVYVAEKVAKALHRSINAHDDLEEALRSLREEMKEFSMKIKTAEVYSTALKVTGAVVAFTCPPAALVTAIAGPAIAGVAIDVVAGVIDANETKECCNRIERHLNTYEKEMKQLEYIIKELSEQITILDCSKELKEELMELERYRWDFANRILRVLHNAGISVAKELLFKFGLL